MSSLIELTCGTGTIALRRTYFTRFSTVPFSLPLTGLQKNHDLASKTQSISCPINPLCSMITADIDDSTYVALDEATKKVEVDVVYAKSFYCRAEVFREPEL